MIQFNKNTNLKVTSGFQQSILVAMPLKGSKKLHIQKQSTEAISSLLIITLYRAQTAPKPNSTFEHSIYSDRQPEWLCLLKLSCKVILKLLFAAPPTRTFSFNFRTERTNHLHLERSPRCIQCTPAAMFRFILDIRTPRCARTNTAIRQTNSYRKRGSLLEGYFAGFRILLY